MAPSRSLAIVAAYATLAIALSAPRRDDAGTLASAKRLILSIIAASCEPEPRHG